MSKDSFLLHKDSLCVLDDMSDEQAGRFIKVLYHYQLTGELLELDFALKMAVMPFINQFKRDQAKWTRSEIGGKIGNLKKYHPEIYNKYINKELTLEAAENMAYPHKEEINSRPPITPDQCRSLNVSVNDSVSVNGNVNVNNKYSEDEIKKAQDQLLGKVVTPKIRFNDFQLQIAKQLGEHIKSTKNINLKVGDIRRWANCIRLLQEQDLKPRKNSEQDIINAMQSVLDNSGKEFFPVIESGKSFREKFTKIESFKKSNQSAKDQQHLEERAALARHYANQQGESC